VQGRQDLLDGGSGPLGKVGAARLVGEEDVDRHGATVRRQQIARQERILQCLRLDLLRFLRDLRNLVEIGAGADVAVVTLDVLDREEAGGGGDEGQRLDGLLGLLHCAQLLRGEQLGIGEGDYDDAVGAEGPLRLLQQPPGVGTPLHHALHGDADSQVADAAPGQGGDDQQDRE